MNVKKLEVNLDYKNIETVSIDYDKDALVKMMKMRRKNKMLKAATVFFKRLRVSYVVLIGVAILSKVRPETDLLLFALAFIFIGAFFDILTDTLYTAERVENLRKGKVR